jgi:hypothetical protein
MCGPSESGACSLKLWLHHDIILPGWFCRNGFFWCNGLPFGVMGGILGKKSFSLWVQALFVASKPLQVGCWIRSPADSRTPQSPSLGLATFWVIWGPMQLQGQSIMTPTLPQLHQPGRDSRNWEAMQGDTAAFDLTSSWSGGSRLWNYSSVLHLSPEVGFSGHTGLYCILQSVLCVVCIDCWYWLITDYWNCHSLKVVWGWGM